jgi:hypothetical protein
LQKGVVEINLTSSLGVDVFVIAIDSKICAPLLMLLGSISILLGDYF